MGKIKLLRVLIIYRKFLLWGTFFALFTNCEAGNIINNDSLHYAAKIDLFIKKAIKEIDFKAGFSITVVKDNNVVFSKGYGYRNIEEKLPVEENTPFYIASATKSFVAAVTKMLADEGVLDLDSPISKYLPNLHLAEPMSIETISIRDLLTHRSGIENLPVVLRTAFTGEQTDSLVLKLLDSSIYKGHQFRYTNLGYIITGIIIKKVTGRSWQDIVEEKIFRSLSMNSSHCRISPYHQNALAQPYSIANNKITKNENIKDDNTMHAAGGIITTAIDVANWLKFIINCGMFNGKELMQERSMEEIRSAQINLSSKFYYYKRFAYGLGWYLSDYNGDLLIHHFGGYSGFRSHISFMPKHKIGVAGFVNDDSNGYYLPDLIADYAYNLLSGKEDYESISEKELVDYKLQLNKGREKAALKDKEQQYKIMILNRDDMKKLKGSYVNEQFGRLDMIITNATLVAHLGSLSGQILKNSDGEYMIDFGAFNSKLNLTICAGDALVSELTLSSMPWPNKSFFRLKE